MRSEVKPHRVASSYLRNMSETIIVMCCNWEDHVDFWGAASTALGAKNRNAVIIRKQSGRGGQCIFDAFEWRLRNSSTAPHKHRHVVLSLLLLHLAAPCLCSLQQHSSSCARRCVSWALQPFVLGTRVWFKMACISKAATPFFQRRISSTRTKII